MVYINKYIKLHEGAYKYMKSLGFIINENIKNKLEISKNIRRKQRNRRKSYKGGSNQNINDMTKERLQLATTLFQHPQMRTETLVSLGYTTEDIAAARQFNENLKKKKID